MKIKAILAAALLLASSAASAARMEFQDWVSDPAHRLIATYDHNPDGSTEQVSMHLDGSISFTYYPADWEYDPAPAVKVQSRNQVLYVNGQAVQFRFDLYQDGMIDGRASTRKGMKFVRMEFWNKSRVHFRWETGQTGHFSAAGMQAAWAHLQKNLPL